MSIEKKLHDQQSRDRIATCLDVSILVEASAGTGKTTSMVQRMCELVRRGAKIETICAITFTRKAAAELRGRFFAKLQSCVRDENCPPDEIKRLTQALGQIDRCFIGTIHSACGKFLSEQPVAAGLGLNFTEIEDQQDAALRQQAWNIFIANSLADSNCDYLQRCEELSISFNDMQASFDSFSQYGDVTHWPCESTAIPTMDMLQHPLDSLKRYSEQMLQMHGEIESHTDALINEVYLKLPQQLENTSFDSPAEVADFFDLFKPNYKKTLKCWPDKETANNHHEKWENFYQSVVTPVIKKFRTCRYELAMEIFHDAQYIYDNLRRDLNVLNFQDLLLKFRDLLKTDAQCRKYFQSQISYLLVDEFQDTDPVQAEIMMLLTADDPTCSNWRQCRPVAGKLFVVGDPKQSIYRFRRADIQTYNFVRQRILDCGGEVLTLDVNFRSGDEVINFVNEIFSVVLGERRTHLQASYNYIFTGRDAGHLPGESDLEGVFVNELTASGNKHSQALTEDAENIAQFIHNALVNQSTIIDFDSDGNAITRPVRADDFLIITTKKNKLAPYATELQKRGIAVDVTGAAQLSQCPQLRWLYNMLRAICNTDDPVALVSYLRSGIEGYSDDELLSFKRCGGKFNYHIKPPTSLEDKLHKNLTASFERLISAEQILGSVLPLRSAIEHIIDQNAIALSTLTQTDSSDTNLAAILKLIELSSLEEIADSPESLTQLLADILDGKRQFDTASIRPSAQSAVRVMNLHKSKGLEAPVVFLAYPRGNTNKKPTLHVSRDDDTLGFMSINRPSFVEGQSGPVIASPDSWDKMQKLEEEFLSAEYARLMYVAATRAGRCLVISCNDREKRRNSKSSGMSNPWYVFDTAIDALTDINTLPRVNKLPALTPQTVIADAVQIQNAIDNIKFRRQKLLSPTYAVIAAKQQALSDQLPQFEMESTDNLGTSWGSSVHGMLEFMLKNPSADLHSRAINCCEVNDLSPSLADFLTKYVKSVTKHPLWQRAISSEKIYSELPFELAEEDDSGNNQIIRGVIDLVFKSEAGWVIVDFKTDSAAKDAASAQKLSQYYKAQLQSYGRYFSHITGETVCELGLLFTAGGIYKTVESDNS